MKTYAGGGSLLLGLALGAGAFAVRAAEPARVSADQVKAGEAVYAGACASCHGRNLEGAAGPALAGPAFGARWNGRPVRDLFEITAKQMPQNAPASLPAEQYRAVVAYVLSRNGYAPGGPPFGDGDLDVRIAAQASGPTAATPLAPGGGQPFPRAPASARGASGQGPDDAALAAPKPGEWLMYNRDYRGQRYSPLAQITAGNARTLSPVCILQLAEIGSFEAGPVVQGGRIYVTTSRNTFAVDATDCRLIWKSEYTPTGPEGLPANRGVALYRGKLFRGTTDGRLLALDAADGTLLWEAQVADSAKGYYLNAAPVAAEGKVFIGESGADQGADGHVHAFEAETGRPVWSFDLIPTGDQRGADTWKQGTEHGGGSVWTTLSYDPPTHRLYASVGNPAPDYDGATRPGDNLFTDSVVVLDAATGKLDWWVQQVPHDTHDWDTAAAPVVYDQGSQAYMAVATKGGWLYLYDRNAHRLLSTAEVTTHENSEIESGRAPVHTCPGQYGGVEWNGPAYDPKNRSLVVASVDWCGAFQKEEGRYIAGSLYMAGRFTPDPVEQAKGWVRSFDATTGKELWRYPSPTPMIAAVTPTAGGVVFTGDLKGDFLTLDARTGKVLYRFNTGGAIGGGIATYTAGDRQYVAVTSGNASRTLWRTTGAPTLILFGLPR